MQNAHDIHQHDLSGLTPNEAEALRLDRLHTFLKLNQEMKERKEQLDKLKETIKLDMIDGGKYDDGYNYLLLTEPIKTIYDMEAFVQKFGEDLALIVSKIQNAEVNKKVKDGTIKKEDLGGTFHTEPDTPQLRPYKRKDNGAS